MEASRGCPYHCTFCVKEEFRDAYRRRPLPLIVQELDRLLAYGVTYVYFIDEIFLPDRALLETVLADGDTAAALATHGRCTVLARHTCRHRVDELLAIARELGLEENVLRRTAACAAD